MQNRNVLRTVIFILAILATAAERQFLGWNFNAPFVNGLREAWWGFPLLGLRVVIILLIWGVAFWLIVALPESRKEKPRNGRVS